MVSFLRRSGIIVVALVLGLAWLWTLVPAARAQLGTGGEKLARVRISPEMELLAGVLTQTSWIKERGPSGEGNEYFRALKEFMAAYKDHRAVKIAQSLTNRGFAFDAPIAFICHCGPLPDLNLDHEYSGYVVGRAGGREILEEFRIALRDLAGESKFLEFFHSWEPEFKRYVDDATEGFDFNKVVEWLESFFGWEAQEFHIILAPAMFPGGGYGATITTRDGKTIAYQVVRARGVSEKAPDFPSGRSLEMLTLHELGHSFVNPAMDMHSARVSGLGELFKPVEGRMRDMAYPNVHVFMNEQVLRAVTALAARDLYGEADYEAAVDREQASGFYLTELVIEELEVYRASRDRYPRFTDFVPHLLNRLERYQAERAQGRTDGWSQKTADWLRGKAFLVAGFLLIVVGLAVKLRRGRPEHMK
ncbi:MAG: DUF4932 domain-containing protein [Firmicutes bacterium]|nr:DUF4932 domain-containing protein [Candidatus Fermentithermobacillaceae bacterium]